MSSTKTKVCRKRLLQNLTKGFDTLSSPNNSSTYLVLDMSSDCTAEATPAPPVGPAIGAFGLNIAFFVKDSNLKRP